MSHTVDSIAPFRRAELREIVPAGTNIHAYAEYRGMRYYLGSGSAMHDLSGFIPLRRLGVANLRFHGAEIYFSHKVDAMIDGNSEMLIKEMQLVFDSENTL